MEQIDERHPREHIEECCSTDIANPARESGLPVLQAEQPQWTAPGGQWITVIRQSSTSGKQLAFAAAATGIAASIVLL
ncbi:MAG TPA: hypothetical protein VLN59_09370, partial [Burkholderiales bacterium]|nr:hypothetical protein [Burkholderiales bacterium]